MARISVDSAAVEIDLTLVDEILSLHGTFRIALTHVRSVSADPVPHELFRGVRIGTNIPGVKVAGTFIGDDGITYYDFRDPSRCVTLELTHEHYRHVVVEVGPGEDPAAIARKIAGRIGSV